MGQHESKSINAMLKIRRCIVCDERSAEGSEIRSANGSSVPVCARCMGRGQALFVSRQKINETFCKIILDNAS
jgi:hypothetical protein